MPFMFSRVLSVATAAYAVFAMVKPRHLGSTMTRNPMVQPQYDLVATMFGPRDLVVSSLALFSRSPRLIQSAMVARVALDLSDAAILTPRASSSGAKAKVLAATLTWASLNTAALVIDSRKN